LDIHCVIFLISRLRLERGQIGEEIGVLDRLEHFQNLELIDFELKVGFGAGFVKLQMLKKVLLIPAYKDEVFKFGLLNTYCHFTWQ